MIPCIDKTPLLSQLHVSRRPPQPECHSACPTSSVLLSPLFSCCVFCSLQGREGCPHCSMQGTVIVKGRFPALPSQHEQVASRNSLGSEIPLALCGEVVMQRQGEGERGCSEETGRLQTDIQCSFSVCHGSMRSGSRRAACIFAVLFLHWGLRFWTVKLNAGVGIQICDLNG